MGDRLAYLDIGSCKHRETLAHVVEHLFMTAVFQLKRSFYLAHVYTEGVFVEFCSSGLARYGLDLGHLQQQSLGTCTYRVALFERDAGQRGYIYGERAFVELGQKAASQTEEDAYGYGKQRCRAYNNLACVGENPQQCALVILLEPYGKEGFLGHFAFALAEQVAAQHGGERQCHEG